jgi:competence protein ComEC
MRALAMHPGERWRLTVRLQRPHGNANPGGFDYEAWLLEQGVRATGYVRAKGGNRRLDPSSQRRPPGRTQPRCAARTHLDGAGGQPYAGVIVALVIGDQRGIDQPTGRCSTAPASATWSRSRACTSR